LTTEVKEAFPTTGTWEIDKTHSTVRFSLRHHAVAEFRMGFAQVSGTFDAEAGSLAGSVMTHQVQAPVNALFDFLQRELDNENHKKLTFSSTSITGNDDGTLDVEGELTIKGHSAPVTGHGTWLGPQLVGRGDDQTLRLGMTINSAIDRREWGLNFNNVLPSGLENLSWEVGLQISLELISKP